MAETPLEISIADVRDLQATATGDFQLVDCREPAEWDIVHLSDAVLLPMSEIAARIGELEAVREKRIVVYCHHGGRSLRVTQFLRQQGFHTAQSMAGGIDAWALEVDPAMPRY